VPDELSGERSESEVRNDPRHLAGIGTDRVLQAPLAGGRGHRSAGEPKFPGPVEMIHIKGLAIQDAKMNLVEMDRMGVRGGIDQLPQFETSQTRPSCDGGGPSSVFQQ